jgi:uncharacterized protein (DUF1697 family)
MFRERCVPLDIASELDRLQKSTRGEIVRMRRHALGSCKEVYVYFVNGCAGSKITAALLKKMCLATSNPTARNWKTICRMNELVGQIAVVTS